MKKNTNDGSRKVNRSLIILYQEDLNQDDIKRVLQDKDEKRTLELNDEKRAKILHQAIINVG